MFVLSFYDCIFRYFICRVSLSQDLKDIVAQTSLPLSRVNTEKTTTCGRDRNNKAAQKKKEFWDSVEKKLHAHPARGDVCHTQNAKQPTTHTPPPYPPHAPLPLQRKWDMLMKLAGLSWLKTKHFGTSETSEWVRQPGGGGGESLWYFISVSLWCFNCACFSLPHGVFSKMCDVSLL